jgi:hypothetical protein
MEGIPRTPDAPPSVLKAPVFPGRGFSFAPPAAADFRNWPLPRPAARSQPARRHVGAAAWRDWVPAVLTEREAEKLLKGGTE